MHRRNPFIRTCSIGRSGRKIRLHTIGCLSPRKREHERSCHGRLCQRGCLRATEPPPPSHLFHCSSFFLLVSLSVEGPNSGDTHTGPTVPTVAAKSAQHHGFYSGIKILVVVRLVPGALDCRWMAFAVDVTAVTVTSANTSHSRGAALLAASTSSCAFWLSPFLPGRSSRRDTTIVETCLSLTYTWIFWPLS